MKRLLTSFLGILGVALFLDVRAQQIRNAEYFIDQDPGIGKGTAISIGSLSDSVSVTGVQFSTTSLALGLHTLHVRVQDELGNWSAYKSSIFNIRSLADTLTNKASPVMMGEYFVDTDPGVGKGISIPITQGDSISVTNIAVSTDNLSLGQHSLHVRVRDALHRWSSYRTGLFSVTSTSRSSDSLINAPGRILYAEYFVDSDPGLGKGTSMPFVTGDSISISNISVSTDQLSLGLHTLHVRVRDEFNRWSAYHSSFFSIQPAKTQADSLMNVGGNVVRAEYFVDTDPGLGKGIAIPIGVGDSISVMDSSLSTNNLAMGQHTLHVRVKDEFGRWSAYRSSFFTIQPSMTKGDSLLNKGGKIVAVEYFVDADPGLGKGIPFAVSTPQDSVSLQSLEVNTDTLQEGQHVLNVRVKDVYGRWSAYSSTIFRILDNASSGNEEIKLPFVTGEYFIGDIDPGYGNADVLSNLPTADSSWDFTPEIPTAGLGAGTYAVTFRLMRQDGTWTFNNTFTFDICLAFPPAPTAQGTVLCGGSGSVRLVAQGVDSLTKYSWFNNSWGGTPLNYNGDSAYTTPTLTQDTYYWVAQIGTQCTGPRTKVAVQVVDKLESPIIPGIVNHCGGGRIPLTVSGAPEGGTYRWYNALHDKKWLAEGDTFVTDSIILSRKYYVSTVSKGDLCESPTRDSITVLIKSCSAQTITFPKLLDIVYGEVPYIVLQATASSKLPVVYKITGPVDVQGDTLLPNGYGKVTVTATQPGSANFYAAASISQSFQITSRSDTVEHFSIHYDSTLCTGEGLQFVVAYSNNAIYEWTGPHNFTSSLQSPSRYNLDTTDAGRYFLTVKGSKDTLHFSFKIYVYKSPPKISLYSLQQNSCDRDDTLFTVGNNLVGYQWLFNAKNIQGATDSIYVPRFTGVYSVAGYDANNCSANSDLLYVDVEPDTLPQITIVKSQGYLTTAIAQSYQWFVEGYFIVGGNKQELPCYFNGTYQVRITDNKGCEKFSVPYTVNDSHLGNLRPDMVNENGQVQLDSYHPDRIDFMPNPASNLVTLSWMSPERGALTITVLNEMGSEIARIAVDKENELFAYSFDLSEWKSGVYMVSLGNDKKNVKGKLIVVK